MSQSRTHSPLRLQRSAARANKIGPVRSGPVRSGPDRPNDGAIEKVAATMKLITPTFVSVDGVMQGVGAPDEDRSGGFERGGWTTPDFDHETPARPPDRPAVPSRGGA